MSLKPQTMRGSPSALPVDQVVQPRGAVAAAQRVDHVDAGLAERPLQVGGPLLVGPREIAVHLAVVGAEYHAVAARLEVGGRLLDVRAGLRRAGRRDDRDRRPFGQGRRLDPLHRACSGSVASAPRETLSIASAISAPDAWSEPSTSSTWSSATCSSFSGPRGSNHSATPVHCRRIA